MNFISTNHQGGIGNVMFKLAAAISLALDNNIDYIFSNEFLRPVDQITTHGQPDYRRFYDNILRNITFIDTLPGPYTIYNQPGFHYQDIPYQLNTNLLLTGHYQSDKFFINNKQYIIDLYKPSTETKKLIQSSYNNLSEYISIHVRRGDYLQYPNHHPQQTIEYYQSAVYNIGLDKTYMIFSDDINGCKSMFEFIPNKIFYNSGIDWLDMYIMSMCKHNIICNSSFSWWGAYLNENPTKIVIAPKKWFGVVYESWDTTDLIPASWLIINK